MKLRSGRILKPVAFKRKSDRKAMDNLVKMMEDLNLEDEKRRKDEEDGDFMNEAKTFITFFFYHCCKYLANNVRLERIEREQGLTKPYLFEWKVDENFWKDSFRTALLNMRCRISLYTLSRAFYFFTRYEHPAQLEDPEAFAKMDLEIKCHLEKLYYQEGCTRMVELMHQQDQVMTRAFPIPDKKVYLNQLADDLACQLINPVFDDYTPNGVPWPKIFKYSKERCCYIPEINGGRTVRKLPSSICNFSMFSSPVFQYQIIETKETFSSPEKDIRKAFLLHQKLTEKNSEL